MCLPATHFPLTRLLTQTERAVADQQDSYNFMWFRAKGMPERVLADLALVYASSLAPGLLVLLGCAGSTNFDEQPAQSYSSRNQHLKKEPMVFDPNDPALAAARAR